MDGGDEDHLQMWIKFEAMWIKDRNKRRRLEDRLFWHKFEARAS